MRTKFFLIFLTLSGSFLKASDLILPSSLAGYFDVYVSSTGGVEYYYHVDENNFVTIDQDSYQNEIQTDGFLSYIESNSSTYVWNSSSQTAVYDNGNPLQYLFLENIHDKIYTYVAGGEYGFFYHESLDLDNDGIEDRNQFYENGNLDFFFSNVTGLADIAKSPYIKDYLILIASNANADDATGDNMEIVNEIDIVDLNISEGTEIVTGYDGSVAFVDNNNSRTYWYDSSGILIKILMPSEGDEAWPDYVSNSILICSGEIVSEDPSYSYIRIETPTTSVLESNIQGMEEEVKSGIFSFINNAGKLITYDLGGPNSQITRVLDGPAGPQGPQGEIGPQGPQGLDSSAIQDLISSGAGIELNENGNFSINYSIETSDNLEQWQEISNVSTIVQPSGDDKQFLRLTIE